MPKICGVEEARQALPSLLDRARRGESTIITRHGTPVAAVVPIERALARSTVSLAALSGSGKGLWLGKDSIAAQRDEWD